MLPATAPQPSVIDGKTLVVMPVEPCGAGVFTSTRLAGMRMRVLADARVVLGVDRRGVARAAELQQAEAGVERRVEIRHEEQRKHRRKLLRRERVLLADAGDLARR